jgi:hypothetical protein
MSISKTQAPGGQCINIGCINQATFPAVTADIPNPQIISQNKDDIGLGYCKRDSRKNK